VDSPASQSNCWGMKLHVGADNYKVRKRDTNGVRRSGWRHRRWSGGRLCYRKSDANETKNRRHPQNVV